MVTSTILHVFNLFWHRILAHGRLWSPHGECICSSAELRRYRHRISSALRDRLDMKINVRSVHALSSSSAPTDMYSPLSGDHQHWDSEHMRENVRLARERSAARYRGLGWSVNAQLLERG